MPHYRVLLNGRNFWLNLEGQPERLGFFTTCFVEAYDEDDAESKAMDLIRRDPKLNIVLNERSDPPRIFVDEVSEIKALEVPSDVHGYTFFPDGKDADA